METDRQIIKKLGGATKVAELLGFKKIGGRERVQNWLSRGIPAKMKLLFPQYFQAKNNSNEKP